MEILFALFLMSPVILGGIAAYLVSLITRKRLERAGNERAKVIGRIAGTCAFFLIFITVFLLAAYNIRIER